MPNNGAKDLPLIYNNDGSGKFTDSHIALVAYDQGMIALGDFNRDGKTDFVMTGDGNRGTPTGRTEIFLNTTDNDNTAPTTPTHLSFTPTSDDGGRLSWSAATDDNTPQPGLTYNLAIGTTPDAQDVLSAEANLTTGARYTVEPGNSGWGTFHDIKGLTNGKTYYWKVQAVDGAYMASPFASGSFVMSTNAAPKFAHDNISVNMRENSAAVEIPLAQLAASDTDSSDTLTWSQGGTAPQKGTLSIQGSAAAGNDKTPQVATYTPTPNATGEDTFTIAVSDGKETDTLTVSVNIYNVVPQLEDTTFTVAENASNGTVVGTITPTGDTNGLTFSINDHDKYFYDVFAVNRQTGEITIAHADKLDYETHKSYFCHVGVDDEDTPPLDAAETSATITINVTDVNDAPSAVGGTAMATEDTAYTLSIADFNYHDADGDGLANIRIESLPSNGSLLLNGNRVSPGQEITAGDITRGALKFIPADNAHGDTYSLFSFSVSDGTDYSDLSGTVSINVAPINDAPTVSGGTITVLEDNTQVLTLADIGYQDVDGDSLVKLRIDGLPTKGQLRLNGQPVSRMQEIGAAELAAGQLTFTPAKDANGDDYDRFYVSATDGTDYSAQVAHIGVNVTPQNDAPTATDATLTVIEDTPYALTLQNVGYHDVDEEPLAAIRIESLPAAGTLSLNGQPVTAMQEIAASALQQGELSFTPADNANGDDYAHFTLRVTDGSVYATSSNTLRINVTAVNDLPTAKASGEALPDALQFVEDTPADFDLSGIRFEDPDSLLTITLGLSAGRFDTPADGSHVGDGVTVTQAAPDTIVLRGKPDDINLYLQTPRHLRYLPEQDMAGEDVGQLAIVMDDGAVDGIVRLAPIALDIQPQNDAPTASGSTAAAVEDTAYTLKLSDFGYQDVEGDNLSSVRIDSLPRNGQLWLDGNLVVQGQEITAAA
ncbi:Ig-like domain-containing protein, partial [Shewanella sp. YIC-542]|uniref:Ig-like domain-containing protein n=1 Tax=Shewanella mytili TaxID=3377111 RepID=UPI00398EAB39